MLGNLVRIRPVLLFSWKVIFRYGLLLLDGDP